MITIRDFDNDQILCINLHHVVMLRFERIELDRSPDDEKVNYADVCYVAMLSGIRLVTSDFFGKLIFEKMEKL